VQGCVADTFEATLPLVKQFYDAVREGRYDAVLEQQ
jgi:hypothetical protein